MRRNGSTALLRDCRDVCDHAQRELRASRRAGHGCPPRLCAHQRRAPTHRPHAGPLPWSLRVSCDQDGASGPLPGRGRGLFSRGKLRLPVRLAPGRDAGARHLLVPLHPAGPRCVRRVEPVQRGAQSRDQIQAAGGARVVDHLPTQGVERAGQRRGLLPAAGDARRHPHRPGPRGGIVHCHGAPRSNGQEQGGRPRPLHHRICGEPQRLAPALGARIGPGTHQPLLRSCLEAICAAAWRASGGQNSVWDGQLVLSRVRRISRKARGLCRRGDGPKEPSAVYQGSLD
mmetsp:Transcript_80364/g.215472  ORF Transcript_80364/g.215472 Transcript_80364/m.215472 type:complete len:286 (-) Transcript_80364:3563-4420(-)